MNVVLVESHKSPVVSVQMWVRTGSADEQKGEEGISHFIEHLVFKGTEKYNVGEIASKVESSGGELNAYTSFDQTVFYVTISSHYVETAMDVVSQMMGHPIFDPTEVDNEREVVLEEIKRTQDNPHRQASRMLFSTVYKKHPYGLPVIGFDKVIKKVSVEKLKEYFNARYVPTNMTLVIAGDVSAKDIKPKIKSYFENFEDHKLRKIKRIKEPKQEKKRIKVEKTDFKENLFYISWPVPSVRHKDIPALDVLSLILGQGDSSRLLKKLRIEQPLVNYIGASTYTPKDPGFFTISASLNHENLEKSLEILLDELEHVLNSAPDLEELEKSVINMESDEFYGLETVEGLARKVGTFDFLFDDYSYFKEFLKQIRELTTKDILRVARKYLKPETMTFTYMTTGDKEQAQKTIQKWTIKYKKVYESSKAPRVEPEKVKKLKWGKTLSSKKEAPIENIKLNGGAKLLVKPSFETPVINLRMATFGGLRYEPESKSGITELASRVWANQTKSLTEVELYQKLDHLASSFSAFGGRNTVGLNLNTLTAFFDPTLDIFFDVLKDPHISEDIVEREKIIMKEKLSRKDDNPTMQAMQATMKSLYGEHPYSRELGGTEESLASITTKDVKEYIQSLIPKNDLNFALVGQVDVDKCVEKLNYNLKGLKDFKKPDQKHIVPPLTKNVYNYMESKKEQSHIILAYPGLVFDDKRVNTLQMIQSILAGQGGRLFIELRDKKSLAYSVAPLRMEGIEKGYFGTYIGCSPEKGKLALQMMRDELKKLQDTLVGPEELDRAKRYLIGRHDIDLQKNSSVAATILFDDLYGLKHDAYLKYSDEIQSITAEEVMKLAQDIFSQNHVVTCVGSESVE